MTVVTDLLALLELERLEINIYRGGSRDLGSGRVFGGQVFAQALVAARRTVEDGREAHSVHGYFLREGDFKAPIVYFVDRPRDGRSFTSRRVTAIQHGEAIFHLSASFHLEEAGLDHQVAMPDVPAPETLPPDLEVIRARAEQIPEHLRAVLTQDRPIDLRTITPADPFAPAVARRPEDACRQVWFRVIERMPDSTIMHQAVLAYASDYGFLPTALLPHGIAFRDPRLMIASLDHTVWMHRAFRADEWLLYVSDSPSSAGARGFVRGQVFTRKGVLVASVAQEGLIRMRELPRAPKTAPEIHALVREKYGAAADRAAAGEASECCGTSCCGGETKDPITSDLYAASEVQGIPASAVLASLGCGNPTALADLKAGETVLDLGSGGGIDVLLSAQRVGPTGHAYGLDMTDEMLALARRNAAAAGATNVTFLKGQVEQIPLPDNSVDVIISNCVINLAADKPAVLREAFRVLKPGGRFAVSDVVVRGEVPADVRRSMELWVGCIAGALEEQEFLRLLSAAGFVSPSIEPTRVYKAEDARAFLKDAGLDAEAVAAEIDGTFCSAFVRAIKPGIRA